VDLFDEGGEKSWISVRRASDPVEKRIEAVKRIQNNLKPNDYFDLLREYLNVDDALLDEIDELYGERGDIVHGLMGLMKENWFEIKAKTESWGRCVEALIQLLREELSIHDGLYSGLQD